MTSGRETPRSRTDFAAFAPVHTRWGDNDVYGHVNNVQYYAFFDTAVNRYLIERGALEPLSSPVIGLVVETACVYFTPLSFPETIEIGIAVGHVGRSSVRYEVAAFREGADLAAAQGRFVHVYVDAHTRRPTALPAGLRAVLEQLER